MADTDQALNVTLEVTLSQIIDMVRCSGWTTVECAGDSVKERGGEKLGLFSKQFFSVNVNNSSYYLCWILTAGCPWCAQHFAHLNSCPAGIITHVTAEETEAQRREETAKVTRPGWEPDCMGKLGLWVMTRAL